MNSKRSRRTSQVQRCPAARLHNFLAPGRALNFKNKNKMQKNPPTPTEQNQAGKPNAAKGKIPWGRGLACLCFLFSGGRNRSAAANEVGAAVAIRGDKSEAKSLVRARKLVFTFNPSKRNAPTECASSKAVVVLSRTLAGPLPYDCTLILSSLFAPYIDKIEI